MVGLREGLKLARERRFPCIEVECDSKNVVNLIKEENSPNHPLHHVIEDCRRLMGKPWECWLKHIKRTGNGAAATLAKMGQDMEERFRVMDCQPQELML